MNLTLQQIWERYSEIDFIRTIEIKRRLPNGTYESSWQNVETLANRKINTLEAVQDISIQVPNDTYSLGTVTVDNATLLFENPYGEMSNESNANSIFLEYLRHMSQLRIIDGYVDKYTDPANPVLVTAETFSGVIDDKQCSTSFENQETIIVTGVLATLLQQYTKKDLLLSGINSINNWVYSILNRVPFTTFFTVSSGNISAGLNITTFDMNQYDEDTTLFDILQDLAYGHSIFYVRAGVFYFTSYDPTPAVIIDFGMSPDRKEKFNNYNSGTSRVKDKWYWSGTNLSFVSTGNIYNVVETVDIKGITNTVDRQTWLNYVGARVAVRKATFDLTLPFLPILFIKDRVTVVREGLIPEGAFLFDMSRFDEGALIDPLGAITISGSQNWMVRGLKYTKKLATVLTLEAIIVT